jgi:hypothetical protein
MRYDEMRDAAWRHDGVLTLRGHLLADNAASEVPRPHDYMYTTVAHKNYQEFKIKGKHLLSKT